MRFQNIHCFLHFLFFTYFSHSLLITAGCENGCSRNGQCTLEDGEYRCECNQGWAGSDCSIPLEMNCKDNIDNDNGEYSELTNRYLR